MLFQTTVGVECSKIGLTVKDRTFLAGIIYLNPLLQRSTQIRIPKYSFGRFANKNDLLKAYPDADPSILTDEMPRDFLSVSKQQYSFREEWMRKVSSW